MHKSLSRLVITLMAMTLAPSSGLAVDAPPGWTFSDAHWEKVDIRDSSIQLYQWKIPGSDVAAFKAEGTIDAPISRVAAVIQDANRRSEWTPSVKEAKIIRTLSKTEWLEYWHLETPFVIKDRDIVVQIQVLFDASQKRVVAHFFTDESPEARKDAPKTEYVHAAVRRGAYIFWPTDQGRKTQFLYQAHIDLGGTVPKWLTASFEREYPVKTITGLREQVAKKNIQENSKVNLLFEGTTLRAEDVM